MQNEIVRPPRRTLFSKPTPRNLSEYVYVTDEETVKLILSQCMDNEEVRKACLHALSCADEDVLSLFEEVVFQTGDTLPISRAITMYYLGQLQTQSPLSSLVDFLYSCYMGGDSKIKKFVVDELFLILHNFAFEEKRAAVSE